MTTVQTTDPAMVNALSVDLPASAPACVRYAQPYGPKIATIYRVRYGNRWRRVYVVNYGNAGSAYIIDRGVRLFLDMATEYALSDGLSDATLGLTQ